MALLVLRKDGEARELEVEVMEEDTEGLAVEVDVLDGVG